MLYLQNHGKALVHTHLFNIPATIFFKAINLFALKFPFLDLHLGFKYKKHVILQYTALGNTVSSRQAVTCGIPQGSSLSPVLFLIYINDLPNCSSLLTFRVFADHTNVFASVRDLKTLEQLINTELKNVKIWCDANKSSINFSKTNFMIVKSPRKAERSGRKYQDRKCRRYELFAGA